MVTNFQFNYSFQTRGNLLSDQPTNSALDPAQADIPQSPKKHFQTPNK